MSAAPFLKAPATPFTLQLKHPLGQWVVACKRCRGFVIEPSLATGLERKGEFRAAQLVRGWVQA